MPFEPIDLGEEADKSHWPAGVSPISWGQMDMLGVDKAGVLHWDGKPVEVQKRISLTRLQQGWAIVFGIAGLLAALATVAQGWVAAHDWACRTTLIAWRCPK